MSIGLPTITVVTPSLNQARFLDRTIRSVLDQGYPRLEYIIMDGGSTDGSLNIIERYGPRLSRWVSGPDGGQAAAINAGWRMATGAVLAWLNSDDFYLPGALMKVGEAFASSPDASVVYGQTQRVDADGRQIGTIGSPFHWRTLLYSYQVIPQPSAFFSRTALDAAGPLDESLRFSMDYDLLLRLVRKDHPIMLPTALAGTTIHDDAKTTLHAAAARRETHQVRLRYARGLGAVLVQIQPALLGGFHRLPRILREMLRRLGPRRVYQDAAAPVRSADVPEP